jgi:nucleoside-diphosphate-sugar epimerase
MHAITQSLHDHQPTVCCARDQPGSIRRKAPVGFSALLGLPIYGDGMNVRDWLYVSDHCAAIRVVLENGRVGETYNIGGWNEMPNLDMVHRVCGLLDEFQPNPEGPALA